MAVWLWVTDLAPKNDWIEVKHVSLGSTSGSGGMGSGFAKASTYDAHFTLDPGRFRVPLYNWVVRGRVLTAYVFFDPQTEYQLIDAIGSGISSSGNSELISLSINYASIKVEYSGAP